MYSRCDVTFVSALIVLYVVIIFLSHVTNLHVNTMYIHSENSFERTSLLLKVKAVPTTG